jgi:2-dehydro-3-deoxyphosphooctonate aldolase (KDO 8-P synthase)
MEDSHWINRVGNGDYLEESGTRQLLIIAGPCVIEGREFALETAHALSTIATKNQARLVFKASYDKANRTSHNSFRGVGLDTGLTILDEIKSTYHIPITSDVHGTEEVGPASEVLDIIQIPAFLSRQTDLIQASAKTGAIINVKKGQFLSPWDMKQTVEKIRSTGNERALLTERGTFFGYQNLVNDFRCVPIMKQFAPVLFDITHSVQVPGGMGTMSGGERKYIPMLAKAAVASGVYGIFMETHPDPTHAKSDAFTQFPLDLFEKLLQEMLGIFSICSQYEMNWEALLKPYEINVES